MLKKVLVVSLMISIALFGVSLAAEQSRSTSSSITELDLSATAMSFVNLTPQLQMICCSSGSCADQLEDRGFLIVQQIEVWVKNYGNDASSSDATGKVEFFDVLKNKHIAYSFTAAPTAPKARSEIGVALLFPGSEISLVKNDSGIATKLRLSGLYLVNKDEGITASVTYQGNTKTSTINECYVVPID